LFFYLCDLDALLANTLVGLFAVAVAHALVVAVMISTGHISGGHLNPAVTLGLLLGGHITVVRSALYWIVQLLAASAASFLLTYLTGGLVSLYSFLHLSTNPFSRSHLPFNYIKATIYIQ